MALIKCPECDKEISDKASSCPNCGCPLNTTQTDNQTSVPLNEPASPTTTKKKKHGCLTIILILIVVGLIGSCFGGKTKKTDSGVSTSIAKETSANVLTKEDAQLIDNTIWNYVYPVVKANNDLMAVMTGYSDGNISELDFYNSAQTFKDYVQQVWGNPPSITDENGKKYLASCRDYVIIEQTMADSLLKYIDTKKTSDLSKVQENIELCTQAVQIVASNRGTFLGINDFTDEEIKKIAEDSMQ